MKYKKKQRYYKDNKQTCICPSCGAENRPKNSICKKCKSPISFMQTTDPMKQINNVGPARRRFHKRDPNRDWQTEMILFLGGALIFCIVISVISLMNS